MATYTSNYGLHQWAPEDNFLRTDFNTDLQKIDTALGEMATQSQLEETDSVAKSKCRVVIGSYIGDGATSRTIHLGFRPAVVMVEDPDSSSTTFALGLDGCKYLDFTIVDGGFEMTISASRMNKNGFTYCYYILV